MRSLVLVPVALFGCQQGHADPPPPEPPRPVQLDRPEVVQFHMRTQLSDLRAVEGHLIAGKLDDAQASAFMLTRPSNDPGLERWQPLTDRVVTEAEGLTNATTIYDGCRRVARVAEACADCHLKTQTKVFPDAAPAPADNDIARHEWAVDRLWEGMVAGTDGPWVRGLEILAGSQMPGMTLPSAPSIAARLRGLANDALARHRNQTETLESRTQTYGEMLVACSGCHTSLGESPVAVKQ